MFEKNQSMLDSNKAFTWTMLFVVLLMSPGCSSTSKAELPASGNRQPSQNDAEVKSTAPKVYGKYEVISCAFLDNKGVSWFGTNNEGVYSYDGKSFKHYSEADGLSNNGVFSITQDAAGNLWFGTIEGLCKFDGKTFVHVPIPWSGNELLWGPGMNDKRIMSLAADEQGAIWFGTWGGGAYHYDGAEFTSFLAKEGRIQEDGKHRNAIQSLLIDNDGNKWFTSMTHGGISKLDGDSMSHFTTDDGLLSDQFYSSYQDSKGNFWFGSLGNGEEGLLKYDGVSFEHFNTSNGLPNNNLIDICEDDLGNIWLASARGLLTIFDGTSFSIFTSKQGETYEGVHFVTKDAKGEIWFGGRYGQLYRYDGAVVKDFTQK
jgi:ligand-binding sensor domain-containing protein